MLFLLKKKKNKFAKNKKYKKYRLLTSFVERYYERRLLFKKIKKITDENLRDRKSIFFRMKISIIFQRFIILE